MLQNKVTLLGNTIKQNKHSEILRNQSHSVVYTEISKNKWNKTTERWTRKDWQLVRKSSRGMAFLVRLSLASNGWMGRVRLRGGSRDIKIADLLEMIMGTGSTTSCFVRPVASTEPCQALLILLVIKHFSKLWNEAMEQLQINHHQGPSFSWVLFPLSRFLFC